MVFISPLTPQDKAKIRELVSYWNTKNLDTRIADHYNVCRVLAKVTAPGAAPIYRVHLSSTNMTVEPLEFEIPYTLMLELDSISEVQGQQSLFPVQKPFNGRRRGDMTPRPEAVGASIRVELRMIPLRVGMKSDGGIKSFAFRCNACEDERFWCRHVNNEFSYRDHAHWSRQLLKTPEMYLAVPLFGCLFHRIRLSKESITTWDGKEETRLLVDPCQDLLVESYRSMDDKNAVYNLICDLEDTVDSHDGRLAREYVDLFRGNRGGIRCSAKTHTYGTNRKLNEWLREYNAPFPTKELNAELTMQRVKALTYCNLTYDLCYFCWLNTESALSLLD